MKKRIVFLAIMLARLGLLVMNDTLDPDFYAVGRWEPPPPFEIMGPVQVEVSETSSPGTIRLSLPVLWLSTGSHAPEYLRVAVACEGYPGEMRLHNQETIRSGQEVVLPRTFVRPGPEPIGSCRVVRAVSKTLGVSGGDRIYTFTPGFSGGDRRHVVFPRDP